MKPGVTQLNQRVQVDSQIRDPSLDVTASPVSTVARSADADHASQQLLQSLGQFTGAFDKFATVKTEEMAKDEGEKAVMDAIARKGAEPVLDDKQSAWYQDESMKLFSQTETARALSDMNDEIEAAKGDPEKLRNLNPRTFMNDWVNKNAAGIKDPMVASAVYGSLLKTLPAKVDELATAKRGQLEHDVKQKQKAQLEEASRFANGQLKNGATAADVWATGDAMMAMGIDEKVAYKATVQSLKNLGMMSVLEGPDGKAVRNPRNGFTVFQHLGADEATQNEVTAGIRFEKGERERAAAKAEAAQEKAQKYDYNQWMGDLKDRQVQGYRLSPDDYMKLEPADRASFRETQINADAKAHADDSYDTGVATVGADNMDGSKEKKQEAFDKLARAQLAAVPFDPSPQGADQWVLGARKVLALKGTGNSSMGLGVLRNQVNEAWQDAPPDGKGMGVGVKTLKALALYREVKSNPNFTGWEGELFDEKTVAYLKAIDQNQKVNDNSLPQAVTFAKDAVSDDNVAATKRWLSTGNGRVAVEKAVKGQLEGSVNIFAEYTDETHQLINEMMGPWLETAALTTRDPNVLGKQFAAYVQKNTVRMDDPDTWKVARFGATLSRIVPIPKDANGQLGFGDRPGKAPLTQGDIANGSYGRALELAQDQLNKAWNKGTGEAKYRLVADWKNPGVFGISKDGIPMPQMTFDATLAWDAYTASAGKTPLVGAVKYKVEDEGKVKARMEAEFNRQYGKLEGARKDTMKVTDVAPLTMPKKAGKVLPGDPGASVRYTPFVLPKGSSLPPPQGIAGLAPPPGLPPATMAGGAFVPPPMPPGLAGKLPPLVAPHP